MPQKNSKKNILQFSGYQLIKKIFEIPLVFSDRFLQPIFFHHVNKYGKLLRKL